MIFTPLSWLEHFTFFICVYVLVESIPAFCAMPAGYEMFCHKTKYVVSAGSAMAVGFVVFLPIDELTQWLLFGLIGNISLFVWPRTLWRYRYFLDDLKLFIFDERIHDD